MIIGRTKIAGYFQTENTMIICYTIKNNSNYTILVFDKNLKLKK